jgi:hypothetical protein
MPALAEARARPTSIARGGKAVRALTSCGNFSFSTTSTWPSFKFRYWSTDMSVPRTCRSFFSSTVTVFPSSVLKNVRKICNQSGRRRGLG